MKQSIYKIKENKNIATNIWRMILTGDTSAITCAGQFINIRLNGHFLRRPISVNDVDENEITIIYKVLGVGTKDMTKLSIGDELDILSGLGNGYSLKEALDKPVLVGGGVGIPPLYNLAKRLLKEDFARNIQVVLGFNTKDEIFYENEFRLLGCDVRVATVDGSYGIKGLVTDIMKDLEYSYFYTCGPEAMLKAICKIAKTDGQMSFEERMGCGFGACMGCSCKTITGYKRICKEGPVLKKTEVLW